MNKENQYDKKYQYVIDGESLGNLMTVLAQLPYRQVANLLVPLEVLVNQQYDLYTKPKLIENTEGNSVNIEK